MPESTYVPLSSVTLSTAQSQVTFSNIPQIYTDLVLVCNTGATTGAPEIYVQVNGDTGTNYSYTILYGTGTAAGSTRVSSYTSMRIAYYSPATTTLGQQVSITNFQNYTNSTTYKTVLTRSSGATNGVDAIVGLWRNTAAISAITIAPSGSTFLAGSTFSLYGIGATQLKATGGDVITTDGTYWYHTFNSSGIFTPQQSLTADYLVIAGGGGGGGYNNAGGGGAGGYRTTVGTSGGGGSAESALSLTALTPYTVTIGGGGTGGTTVNGTNGSNSVFSTITSVGGGGGGSNDIGNANGSVGGSGGGGQFFNGSGAAGTANQGYAGGSGEGNIAPGYRGGGGGGASSVGTNDNGGAGLTSSISGVSVARGGGGGPGSDNAAKAGGLGGGGWGNRAAGVASLPTPGYPNTGGGGGGGGSVGAAGGKGVVIVRYAV
jgi:hypothetical protein